MTEVHGTKATQALIGFVFQVMDTCQQKMVNGHVSLGFWDIMPLINAASTALYDVALVPEEIKNMSDAEKDALERFFIQHMAMEPPMVQKALHTALDALVMILDLYGLFKRPAG